LAQNFYLLLQKLERNFLRSLLHRQLREIADAGADTDSAVADALKDFEDTLQPGLLAIESKTTKFILLGLSYIQRLASYDAIEPTRFHAVGLHLRQGKISSEKLYC
jgi:hypothetical protein